MTTNITDLAELIHATAKEKGFWDAERNIGEMLMLIISELAEALEEHRNGEPALYLAESGKPEGTVVELADALIRCLDTLQANWREEWGSMQTQYEEFCVLQSIPTPLWPETDNFGEALLNICKLVGKSHDNILWLMHVVVSCERLAKDQGGHDIYGAVRIKMEYNTTRPYKHGKAY